VRVLDESKPSLRGLAFRQRKEAVIDVLPFVTLNVTGMSAMQRHDPYAIGAERVFRKGERGPSLERREMRQQRTTEDEIKIDVERHFSQVGARQHRLGIKLGGAEP
jgi:hypothetical protein